MHPASINLLSFSLGRFLEFRGHLSAYGHLPARCAQAGAQADGIEKSMSPEFLLPPTHD
jgi:hypothetical protein